MAGQSRSMRCKTPLPCLVNITEEQEENIKILHDWIEELCDPEENLSRKLMADFDKFTNYPTVQRGTEVDYINIDEITGEISQEKGPVQGKTGQVELRRSDESIFEGSYIDGIPHGFFRVINTFGDIEFFGCFVRGILHGSCWKSLPGGGFLISDTWQFTSDNIIFLYPDCRTGLVGSFVKEEMKSAGLAEVIGCNPCCSCGILRPEMTPPTGPKFCYEMATSTSLSSQPLTPDPYEALFVRVGPSIIPKAGEGLFAKTDIEVETVIGFYNGYRSDKDNTDNDRAYKIMLDQKYDLDIPAGMTTLDSYRATLGHKACHCFEPNCDFDTFLHPRFGLIKCLTSIRDIRKGDEITVHYRYPLNVAPSWYKVAWAKNEKVKRGLPDWDTALNTEGLKLSRNYSETQISFAERI